MQQSVTPRRAAQCGLALGLFIALVANVTYAVPRGPVTVGLGLVAPLVLPVVLYLRTTFTVDGLGQQAMRELATLAVAGPAAAVSYVHTYELVLGANEPWILAVLAPLSSDGLAGMSTLALHRLRQTVATPASRPTPKKRPQQETPPVPATPTLEPLHAAPEPVSAKALAAAEGISLRTAYRRIERGRVA